MGQCILIVDDNPVNLKLTSSLLELEGHEVHSAADAEQAQAKLATLQPDLILMDIAMPGMDGLTLTRLLRTQPRFAALPIVALTASAMRGDDRKALDAGCSGYISKPIDTRQFARQVEQYMQGTQPAPETPRRRVKVVVIDDNRVDLKVMGTLLQVDGHLVLGKESPQDAVAAISASKPDVILLDLQLPGIDGLSFVRLLKSAADTRAIPIAAVTAFPELFPREVLLDAGCAAYWTKPVDTRLLARHIAELVQLTPAR